MVISRPKSLNTWANSTPMTPPRDNDQPPRPARQQLVAGHHARVNPARDGAGQAGARGDQEYETVYSPAAPPGGAWHLAVRRSSSAYPPEQGPDCARATLPPCPAVRMTAVSQDAPCVNPGWLARCGQAGGQTRTGACSRGCSPGEAGAPHLPALGHPHGLASFAASSAAT